MVVVVVVVKEAPVRCSHIEVHDQCLGCMASIPIAITPSEPPCSVSRMGAVFTARPKSQCVAFRVTQSILSSLEKGSQWVCCDSCSEQTEGSGPESG